jgi:hypothetical protein
LEVPEVIIHNFISKLFKDYSITTATTTTTRIRAVDQEDFSTSVVKTITTIMETKVVSSPIITTTLIWLPRIV